MMCMLIRNIFVINVFDAFFLLISCTRVNTDGKQMCDRGEEKGFSLSQTVHRSERAEADRPRALARPSLPELRLFF